MNLLLLIPMLMMTFFRSEEPDAAELRMLFYRSPVDREASDKLSRVLVDVDEHSSPLLLCYKGVAEMMQAKHVFNPFNKLARFNRGRTLIEEAVSRDPGNLEQRFLRFAIQSNLPGFLGYKDELQEDKIMLLNGVSEVIDLVLKDKIIDYLMASKYCTAAELKRLK